MTSPLAAFLEEQISTTEETSTADSLRQTPELPQRVLDELEEILFRGIEEMDADAGILTFLSKQGEQLIPERPHVFRTDQLNGLGLEVPGVFEQPVIDSDKTWGRVWFENGFSNDNKFDLNVRDKGFLPIAIGERVAVFCGATLAPAMTGGGGTARRFRRSDLTAGWCLVQKRLSELMPAHNGHATFVSAIEKIADISANDILDMGAAEDVARGVAELFGIQELSLSRVANKTSEAPSERLGLMLTPTFAHHEKTQLPLSLWEKSEDGHELLHGYTDGSFGLTIELRSDAKLPSTTADDSVLLTIVLERLLWKLNLGLNSHSKRSIPV